MPSLALEGIGVLITRPRLQSEDLAREIQVRGGTAILFPAIDIVARDPKDIAADVAKLNPADITIFISRNAVEYGIEHASGVLAAIGPTTAAEITQKGHTVAIQAKAGFDSEHLLAEAAFADVDGKVIRIIRGNDGRKTLAKTLRARGASVEYLSTYDRRHPVYPTSELTKLEKRWRDGKIDAVVVMSVQSLHNLLSLLPKWCRQNLSKTLLVTPAARVLKEALNQLPGCHPVLAAGPQTNEIANCLVEELQARQVDLHKSE